MWFNFQTQLKFLTFNYLCVAIFLSNYEHVYHMFQLLRVCVCVCRPCLPSLSILISLFCAPASGN